MKESEKQSLQLRLSQAQEAFNQAIPAKPTQDTPDFSPYFDGKTKFTINQRRSSAAVQPPHKKSQSTTQKVRQ